MNVVSVRLFSASAAIAMCCLAAAAPARSQDTPAAQCPAGYSSYQAVCISHDGDVVNAGGAQLARAVEDTGCTPGYWRYGEVCIARETGDVEMASEQIRAAAR